MVSITFSQPMVEVTSLDELAKQPAPATISPALPGKWRWIGAKTAVFESSGERFPMATSYTVTVAAGTKSATGGALAKAYSFSFQTPPPVMQTYWPAYGPIDLNPVLFVSFDQKIDPAAVLKAMTITAGKQTVSAHLATPERVAADTVASGYVKSAQPGRWMALELDAPLPKQSTVNVRLGAGTPSAEGPEKTVAPQGFDFFTYAPLDVVESQCGWDGCHPLDNFGIRWNNPLDEAKWKPELVKVEPALENLKIDVSGEWMSISGRTKAHTKYRVTFLPALTDKFGQTLGAEKTIVFQVGAARPAFYTPGGEFQVLDPAGGGKLSVFTANHKKLKLKAYKVAPGDWAAYGRYMRAWNEYHKRGTMPGKLVVDQTIDVTGPTDELVETRLDIARAFDDGKGLAIVVVEPATQPADVWQQQVAHAWVQATDIGLAAFVDHDELRAWTTGLRDGKPLAGVDVTIEPATGRGQSGADGVATFKLPAQLKKGAGMIVARRGNDVAMLPESIYWYADQQSAWTHSDTPDALGWYVADDRGMYRPGETARLKGWLRRIGGGEGGDVGGLRGAAKAVSWRASDAQGNEIAKGNATLDVAGGFDFSLALPKTVHLGQVYFELNAHGGGGNVVGQSSGHAIQVQEFRRPEFEVTATAAPGPVYVGESTTVTVNAKYYAGGGLPGAPASWSVYAQPASFSPPGHDGYTFGQWQPWWGAYDYLYAPMRAEGKSFSGVTDASGAHTVRLDFDSVAPARAMSVVANASVQDVNRQGWGAAATLLVHPAAHYVGLKTERYFVNEGEPIVLDAIVTDLDGKQLGGRTIAMRAARVDWSWKNGKAETTYEDVQDCATASSAAGQKDATCTFTPRQGGVYKLRAVVKDAQGRKNESEVTMWVAGGEQPPSRDVGQEQVTLVPDKKEYQAGETAKLLVQAPFAGGEAIVSYRRSGLLKTERLAMTGSSATIRVPIDAAYVPNVWIQVDVVGAAARTDDKRQKDLRLPKRPAFATGAIRLDVPPRERTLAVQVKPAADKVEPGAATSVTVQVKDAQGKPVAGSQVAVVIVDEAVLALTGYKWPDPIEAFYQRREPGVADLHQRAYLVLANPDDAAAAASRGGGGERGAAMDSVATGAPPPPMAAPAPTSPMAKNAMAAPQEEATEGYGGGGQAPPPGIALRTHFDALALFAPAETTSAQGLVTVKVKIPDNLTRYRITAVAVAGDKQFGKGESTVTARLPLMVRPSPPRFLNFGDAFELPVVLQNQTDAPLTVDVAARASNATLAESVGRRVTVPANDRLEVRFPAAAAQPGTARFQLAAVSGKWSDASEVSLPVWTPATTEAFATYGEIDKGAIVQPIKSPADVWTQFGGVQVTTSSTAVAALTDAFLYLLRYPFDCAEQVASRLMTVAALKDVLKAFAAGGLAPESEILAMVQADLEHLRNLQNWDGGFGFWRRSDESWPYISIHAAHALTRLKEKGFVVPADLLARSKDYLERIESHIPAWYPEDCKRALIAYALYVRERMGDPDHERARKLVAEAGGADKLPLEVDGWLLYVLSGDTASVKEIDAIRKHLNNRVDETAGAAHFTTSYQDGEYLLLASDRRADGVILEALIRDQPKSDLIPKVVKGLLAHRKAGRWANTNESAFVLLALDRYFEVFEKVTPDFVARVWLGDRYAGEQAYKGRTTDEHQLDVPMALLGTGTKNLVIDKQGQGRLYYRIGMSYAPKDLAQKPRDAGFTVQRAYEAVDDPKDVSRDAQGVWHVKAGAKVRVRLTLVAPSRRYHVALVDPLPAGLEAMNPALAVTGDIPRDPNPHPGQGAQDGAKLWWWWADHWYEHENLRDERVEAFSSLLWEGVYNYAYVARATTPGTFVVPPTKAEEMYAPETFGRSGTDRLVVE
jgi:uncharacterized protein YfaS (alpha-2-macroglobulin family)